MGFPLERADGGNNARRAGVRFDGSLSQGAGSAPRSVQPERTSPGPDTLPKHSTPEVCRGDVANRQRSGRSRDERHLHKIMHGDAAFVTRNTN